MPGWVAGHFKRSIERYRDEGLSRLGFVLRSKAGDDRVHVTGKPLLAKNFRAAKAVRGLDIAVIVGIGPTVGNGVERAFVALVLPDRGFNAAVS